MKEGKTDFTNETQQNLMKIVEYLATDIFRPTSVRELCEGLCLTQSKVTWALHNLKIRDWAEQVGDSWRLCPRIVKIANSAHASLAEATRRYTASVS